MFYVIFFLLGMFTAWFFVSAPSFAVSMRDWLIKHFPVLGTFVRKE